MALTRATDKIIGNSDGNLNLSGIVTASSFSGPLVPSGDVNVGNNIKLGAASGIVTATSFSGDGSNLTSLPAGLGTALSSTQTSPLNKLYYTNRVLSIASTTTVDHPATGTGAYTQYADIQIEDNADLIIEDGDDLIPDILGLGDNGSTGAGGLGRLRVDTITNKSANGAVNFPNGLVGTSATFTGVLTYEDVTNVDSVGVITARSGIRIGATGANTLISGTASGIGIGTDNPSNALDVQGGTTNTAIVARSTDAKAQISLVDNSTTSVGSVVVGAEGDNLFFTSGSSGAERLRIGSAGQIGLGGANYGTSGQVLTSQGSGSAVQWATPGYGVFEVKHGSSAQSIPRVTYTKVEFKTETYDLDGLFDTTTYRYTPQVAGYYYVAFNIILSGQDSGYEIYAEIKKNGSSVMKSHSGGSSNYGSISQADVYGIVQCNGSSDYLDAYIWHNNASSASRSPDVNMTRMLGYLVRRT